MKTQVNKLIIAALALLSFSAYGAGETVIVDVDAAILGSEQAKVLIAEFKKDTEQDQKEILAMVDDIKKINKQLEQDSAVMSDAEKRKLLKKIEDKKIDIQFKQQKLRQAEKEIQQELLQTQGPKLNKALAELLEEKQYGLVLNSRAVIFATPAMNITKQVTEKLNLMK